jgi:hypothetical protein
MDTSSAQRFYEKALKKYPKAGSYVDGRLVRKDVPNTGSIDGYFGESETLPGIRFVKMTSLGPAPKAGWLESLSPRIKQLAESIRESKEISPLIVGIPSSAGGGPSSAPFIIEGSHRIDALDYLGAKAFPAIVVVSYDD